MKVVVGGSFSACGSAQSRCFPPLTRAVRFPSAILM